jgi:hypothetical protein
MKISICESISIKGSEESPSIFLKKQIIKLKMVIALFKVNSFCFEKLKCRDVFLLVFKGC